MCTYDTSTYNFMHLCPFSLSWNRMRLPHMVVMDRDHERIANAENVVREKNIEKYVCIPPQEYRVYWRTVFLSSAHVACRIYSHHGKVWKILLWSFDRSHTVAEWKKMWPSFFCVFWGNIVESDTIRQRFSPVMCFLGLSPSFLNLSWFVMLCILLGCNFSFE